MTVISDATAAHRPQDQDAAERVSCECKAVTGIWVLSQDSFVSLSIYLSSVELVTPSLDWLSKLSYIELIALSFV